ncbi:MAG: hypothetical protein ACD_38C00091G0004 [uncultured bacterium]|uniref:Uncharacterized protein n=1 Tax=Candidatus Daviesbacteria bacterium GW2011_GWC2_40_12 TaxID=1618431 RepID=A0A0G0T5L5_9BACT|nr:MAG: hypothetical protein ACD_38C00091G0004 [uncultured bacterium]KKQ82968.1 MAG: hypothetical protein UT04_C0042G0012 [Candidatus Daviesbacteria bacterium GW2011_GWF2_38_7]KKR16788.1 MAG: hypothetical protein UT45_C0004G0119 [Candidatus Daviesbacteria bacterium GW2011_GWA2_39_33]KKR24506.1 MAG: hypothetical protein UT54_C0018G0006 [Candidatus Daviesbacteria bacterium GW2011_GWB1_39_5]KKR42430.1 MAG: hypothetical protein UT77_C0002G0083 [Candidatus Daviesbacteria bacterium GW2011_GWC2_40_12]
MKYFLGTNFPSVVVKIEAKNAWVEILISTPQNNFLG